MVSRTDLVLQKAFRAAVMEKRRACVSGGERDVAWWGPSKCSCGTSESKRLKAKLRTTTASVECKSKAPRRLPMCSATAAGSCNSSSSAETKVGSVTRKKRRTGLFGGLSEVRKRCVVARDMRNCAPYRLSFQMPQSAVAIAYMLRSVNSVSASSLPSFKRAQSGVFDSGRCHALHGTAQT